MSQIEIDGYEAIIPNQVYGKDLRGSFGTRVKPYATHVICFSKGRVPTKEEIVNKVVDDLKRNEFSSDEYGSPFKIAYWTVGISDNMRVGLTNRERKNLSLLEKAIDASEIPFPGKLTFMITQGNLNRELVEQLRNNPDVSMQDYYQGSVMENWDFLDMILEFNENGCVSDRTTVLSRLGPGNGEHKNRRDEILESLQNQGVDVMKNLRSICISLSRPGMSGLLLDQTSEVIQTTSAGALEYFIKMCVGYKK